MSEINVIHEFYLILKNMDSPEYLKLISNTEDYEEKEFILKTKEILLQQKHRRIIKEI